MNDVKDLLEQARRQAPPTCADLDRIRELRERKQRNGRIAATAFGLTVTMLIVAGGIMTARGSHSRPVHAAEGGPAIDLSMQPGEYHYEERAFFYSDPAVEPSTVAYQTWWGLNDSGREVDYFDTRDRTFAPGEFPNDTGDLSYLSTDPVKLEQQMRDRTAPGGRSPEPYNDFTPGPGQEGHITAGLVRAIGELLNDPNATPALRAALFQVMSGLQGMDVVPATTDPIGRPAVELKIVTEEQLHEWWFDPQSEQLLASRGSTADGSKVWGSMIVQRAGIADSLDSSKLSTSYIPPTDQSPPPSGPEPRPTA